VAKHNPATSLPNSRPNRGHQWARDKNQKGMGMTEQPYDAAQEREEIAARVASFKATQEKFAREREEYFVTTLENARYGSERLPFWS
jgi:chorismate mutase